MELRYLREKFDENPNFKEVSAQDLMDKLQIDSEETRILGELLDMGNTKLYGVRAGNLRTANWVVGVPDDIEIIYETESSQEYLLKRWDENLLGFQEFLSKPSDDIPIGSINTPKSNKNHEVEKCPVEIKESIEHFKRDFSDPKKVAFIMMKFGTTPAYKKIVTAIRDTLASHGIQGVTSDNKQYHDDLYYNVLTYLYGSGFGIAVFERIEADQFNPNVSFEVGYMLALKKPVCLLVDKTLKLYTDLLGKLYKEFDPHDPAETIPDVISKWLRDKEMVTHSAGRHVDPTYVGDHIVSHREMAEGSSLKSDNNRYSFNVQADGNLVIRDGTTPVLTTRTDREGVPPFKLVMQRDGNMVMYDGNGEPTWASNTDGKGRGPFRLIMQDDGNLVIYDLQKKSIWDSNTSLYPV